MTEYSCVKAPMVIWYEDFYMSSYEIVDLFSSYCDQIYWSFGGFFLI